MIMFKQRFSSILVLLFFLSYTSPTSKIHYLIDDSSYLTIEGTSNVTGFECRCNQVFSSGSLATEVIDNGKKAKFRDGKLTLETRSFDCGQKGISRDMHKALKAETYPFITIDLIEVVQQNTFLNTPQGSWLWINAKANLTIAECTKEVNLEIKGMELDSGRYRFVSSENLKMTSFNIEPPKPMLGLIKVDDEIIIHFDLVITLQDV